MEYTITTPRSEALAKARKARAARLSRIYGAAAVFVLVACALLASYGDTLAGINPS